MRVQCVIPFYLPLLSFFKRAISVSWEATFPTLTEDPFFEVRESLMVLSGISTSSCRCTVLASNAAEGEDARHGVAPAQLEP